MVPNPSTTVSTGRFSKSKFLREGQWGRCRAMWHGARCARAVAEKIGRFQREALQESVPGSFRWTDYRSRPGTNFSISEFLCEIGQVSPQPLYHTKWTALSRPLSNPDIPADEQPWRQGRKGGEAGRGACTGEWGVGCGLWDVGCGV